MESFIDNYVGEWTDTYGRHLRVAKVNATTASDVPIYRESGARASLVRKQIIYGDARDVRSSAQSGTRGRTLDKGFTLHLNFEPAYELDKEGRDSLTVALSRFEEDHFLDQYYYVFQPLSHYVKVPEQLEVAHRVR